MYLIVKRKALIVTMSAVLIFAVVLFVGTDVFVEHKAVNANADVNLGLSFNTDNGVPSGNEAHDELKNYDAYYVGDTSKKTIYLTFDAGYENGYTSDILKTLKKHKVSATFFLVGNFIETSPELVKQMVKEGHTVGNHTMTHPDMSSISDMESFRNELTQLSELYKKTTGKEMLKLYRPPQGKFSEENLKMAKSMGYSTFFWSLAYVDWYNDAQPTKEEAFNKLVPRIHNGAIVLLHSTSKTNCEILDELLTKWEDMGYSFGKLTDLTK